MAYISFEKYGPEYKKLWDTMHIIRDASELQRLSDKLFKHKEVYQRVEKLTGLPWQMIAVMHVREAGEQDIGRFKGVLHNGELIVGTGKKTRLVPARRGPFNTWEEAAVDAIKIQGFDKIKPWPVERILWALEPFNGYGYRNKGLRSPYIWASTNHQQPGKYVADGVFDSNVMDSQVGCAALLKYLGVDKKITWETQASGATAIGGAGYALYHFGTNHWILAGLFAIVSGIALVKLYKIGKGYFSK
jgi:lysozyme family protein